MRSREIMEVVATLVICTVILRLNCTKEQFDIGYKFFLKASWTWIPAILAMVIFAIYKSKESKK